MIDRAIVVVRDRLNDHFRSLESVPPESSEEPVVLIDGDITDSISFKLGALSLLLANIETDTTSRAADPFRRVGPDGRAVPASLALHLNLYLLVVARYRSYEQSLNRLGVVVDHLQSHPVIDHTNHPGLDPRIDRLTIELVTLPFTEQAEIWSALRSVYQPSALYRLRVLRFQDDSKRPGPAITEVETSSNHVQPVTS